jgi:short-subunit dehydrogenase
MSAFVVVITGASSGIGRELAVNLARKPHSKTGQAYNIVLVARSEENLKKVKAECDEAAGKEVAQYFVADATKKDQVEAAADFAVKTFGRVDVWVNNAGRALEAKPLKLTAANIEDMMAVNVYAAVYGCQAAVRVFKAQTPVTGQIVNVSSLLGRNATFYPDGVAYNGAKHFLNAYTDNLRQEIQADEALKAIVVSLYSPGVVATDFGIHAGGDFDNNKVPYAQPVAEVGESLRETIEQRKEDVYSRAMYKHGVDAYIASKGN